nr:MAG TPA: hypothetical protein [Caudoviricetes sp.]
MKINYRAIMEDNNGNRIFLADTPGRIIVPFEYNSIEGKHTLSTTEEIGEGTFIGKFIGTEFPDNTNVDFYINSHKYTFENSTRKISDPERNKILDGMYIYLIVIINELGVRKILFL